LGSQEQTELYYSAKKTRVVQTPIGLIEGVVRAGQRPHKRQLYEGFRATDQESGT
jgi:hypothetical protein